MPQFAASKKIILRVAAPLKFNLQTVAEVLRRANRVTRGNRISWTLRSSRGDQSIGTRIRGRFRFTAGFCRITRVTFSSIQGGSGSTTPSERWDPVFGHAGLPADAKVTFSGNTASRRSIEGRSTCINSRPGHKTEVGVNLRACPSGRCFLG
jgi:hypothetical protein